MQHKLFCCFLLEPSCINVCSLRKVQVQHQISFFALAHINDKPNNEKIVNNNESCLTK